MVGTLEKYYERKTKDRKFRASLLITRFLADLLIEMELKGISQAELAKKLGITEAAVSKFLHQDMDNNPKIETLLKYAEALDISLQLRAGEPSRKNAFSIWKDDIYSTNKFGDLYRKSPRVESYSMETKSSSNSTIILAA